METYSTQVIELLSLGTTLDGIYQMQVVVTHEDRQGTYVIDIDELTFLELEALQPLSGGRARISPYPKWDPYRNTYYSVIIRTTGVLRETLKFTCSEEYINQIQRIRHDILLPSPIVGEQQEITAEHLTQQRSQLLRQLYARVPKVASLLIIAFVLLAVLFISYESKSDHMAIILGGQADAAEGGGVANNSKEAVAPVSLAKNEQQGKRESSFPVTLKSHTSQASAKVQPTIHQKDYEVIDIDEEKKLFGLPKNYVALTFDDGPSPFTQRIVDTLTEHKVAATFLFVGENVKRNPDAVIYASQQGMSIGDHSWDHPVMTKISSRNQSEELSKTSSLLESLTHTPVTLFRPPYGSINDTLFAEVKKQHLKILMWNRDPKDWDHKSPDGIVQYFHGVDASGGIYVLHEDKSTVEALPDILNYLQGKKNLTFAIFK